ncbi:MAG: amidase [Ilumatobacteraceae bacterium]
MPNGPGAGRLQSIGAAVGIDLERDAAEFFAEQIDQTLRTYYRPLESMSDEPPPVRFARTPGFRPAPPDNPFNAWYWRTEIHGNDDGPLAGRTVAVKDNIAVAGVPMMNGASTLEGYVPEFDATVVDRLLEAGATITGKSNCEYFCFSGSSHTNALGQTHNPWKHGYSTGGSSSGSAALVAGGIADLAIGGDQGGSVRVPSSFCGLYGMKPTYGLVPYTGAMAVETMLDHLGPMTSSVADNALLLDVLAGPDGLDPRQRPMPTGGYLDALGGSVDGVRVGILTEGFGHDHSEGDVDEMVRRAAENLTKLGVEVTEVSVPEHRVGMSAWIPIAVEGVISQLFDQTGCTTGAPGFQPTSLIDRHRATMGNGNEFPDILKMAVLMGRYLIDDYGMHYYARAQNVVRRLRAAYDGALSGVDLLVLPTSPTKAHALPDVDADRKGLLAPGFAPITNAAPFNPTEHPALSVPVGLSDGLPVGMMIVGPHAGEREIYRLAHSIEQAGDWRTA